MAAFSYQLCTFARMAFISVYMADQGSGDQKPVFQIAQTSPFPMQKSKVGNWESQLEETMD